MTEHRTFVTYDTERCNGVPFSQVASWLDDVKKKGVRYVTRCPWHNDTHPSLVLYEGTGENRCYCFACGRGGSVIDYVMQHENLGFRDACEAISRQFGIPYKEGVKRHNKFVSPIIRRMYEAKPVNPQITRVEPSYIPMDYVISQMSVENSLSQCLSAIYDPYLVEHVTQEYLLGCYESKHIANGTIFWSIDRNNNVHNGKLQCYCTDELSPAFAHYDKTPGHMFWIGNSLVKQGLMPSDANLDVNCLFGEHLLRKHPSAKVVLVESPKNAVVGACENPEMVWVAAGSSRMLNEERLNVLRGRDVLVIPDRDAIAEWSSIISSMKYLANIYVSDLCERLAPQDKPKYDIADYIITEKLNNTPF